MAQANYVTNAIRVLITAASRKTSTNPVRTASAEPLTGMAGLLSGADPVPKRPRRSFSKSLIVQSACPPAIVQKSTQSGPGCIDLRQGCVASDAINVRRAEEPLAGRRVG
jgi:hypothetical protein